MHSLWLFLLTLVVGIAPVAAQTQQQEKAAQVTTVNAERKATAKTHDFVGRVEAINRVDVMARVKGYLEQILFKEGDLVEEGAHLYQIEKGLFEAAVEQAEGDLERSNSS